MVSKSTFFMTITRSRIEITITPKIKKIQYKGEYTYNVMFEDNRRGNINFKPFLWGEVFKPLKDEKFFQKAFIDDTSGTITWPNGVDIAPETLYKSINEVYVK